MQGHEKQVALYDSLNTRVLGVSRDDVTTLKYWAQHLGLTFPVLSNISGFLGEHFGVVKKTRYVFERRTVIIDKKGVIRYASDGSPYYEDIISMLKKLNEEEE
jgi:peroxiredoxin Q/BCP